MTIYYVAPLTFLAGLILGFFYFPLLWLTVRRLAQSDNPVRFLFTSFLARFFVAALVFFGVMGGQVERLLFALAGFICAREICTKFVGAHGQGRHGGPSLG